MLRGVRPSVNITGIVARSVRENNTRQARNLNFVSGAISGMTIQSFHVFLIQAHRHSSYFLQLHTDVTTTQGCRKQVWRLFSLRHILSCISLLKLPSSNLILGLVW